MDLSPARTIDQEISMKDPSDPQSAITVAPSNPTMRILFHSGLDGTVTLAVSCDRVREGSHDPKVVIEGGRAEFRVVIDRNTSLKLSINALTVDR